MLRRIFLGVFLPFWLIFMWVEPHVHAEGTVINYNITEDTSWTKAGSPYYINGPIKINPGTTLTIEPGVQVVCQQNSGNGWTIYGHVRAIGTQEEPIELTGMYISAWDSYLKDGSIELEYTNLNNTQIEVTQAFSQFSFKNSDVSGGKISLNGTNGVIENNFFHDRSNLAFWSDGLNTGSLLVKGNTFMNEGSSSPDVEIHRRDDKPVSIVINNNNFFTTDHFSVLLDGQQQTHVFDGSNNYWGTTDKESIQHKIYDNSDSYNNMDLLNIDPYAYKPFANGFPLGTLEAPRVMPVNDTSSLLSGFTDADTMVQVWKTGQLLTEGKSLEDGAFQLEIPKQSSGTVLKVIGIDGYQRTSSETNLTVEDKTAPTVPSINTVTDQSTDISGKAEENSSVTVKVDSHIMGESLADQDGNYLINIEKQKAGTVLQVRATDKAGNISTPGTITVKDITAPDQPSGIEEISDQTKEITGLAEPGAIVQMIIEHQVVKTYHVGWDGKFSFSVYPFIKAGTIVSFFAVDDAGNTSDPLSCIVKDKTLPTLFLDVVFPPTTTDPVVRGESEEGAAIQVLKDGQVIAEGTAGANGVFSISIPKQEKETVLSVVAIDSSGNRNEKTVSVLEIATTPPSPPIIETPAAPVLPVERTISRFGGKNRYEVNKQMTAQTADHTLDYVILADALNYPDALASGVLNRSLNSATLLVQNDQTVINDNIAEAKRLLKPEGKILIVGGTGSVSYTVEEAFKKVFPVERIAGKSRIEVAIAVAERVNPSPSEIFLTYGLVFSDALSVVPYATKAGIPIILQYGNGLNPTVQAYIQRHPSIKKATIVSGTGVIPVSIESQLNSLGVTTIERVAGQNRYDTSLLIAQKYFPGCTNVALANGNVFADALSGNQFAYKNDMPIILVENNNAIEATKAFVKNRASQNIFLFGGPATINDNIVNLFK